MSSESSLPLPRSILVVGSGGREHALIQSLRSSSSAPRVVAAPGNAGIAAEASCFPVAADDVAGLVALASRERIEFVVVGPEVPLALGLVDALAAAGIPAYGPTADGARLEASKIFTKQLLLKHAIPTAPAGIFSDTASALEYLRRRQADYRAQRRSPAAGADDDRFPIVIKADGLAAGKGVVVAGSLAEAEDAARSMLDDGRFGESGRQILIEDCLTGHETSLLVVVSGEDYVILPVSQDHKRIGEGDTGPNTGGMGAYSPAAVVTPDLLERIEREIVRPSVRAIAAEGMDFRGTLFIGIMLTADGPSVLEFNTRFGDPETQVVLPRLASDLLELLWAATHRRLAGFTLTLKPEAAICVVIAAAGYPGEYARGETLVIPDDLPDGTCVLHAGTGRNAEGALVATGGRVLGVTALAPTLREAADRAYATCERIRYEGKYYRRDIGGLELNSSHSSPFS